MCVYWSGYISLVMEEVTTKKGRGGFYVLALQLQYSQSIQDRLRKVERKRIMLFSNSVQESP